MDLYEFTDDIAINAWIKVAQNVKEEPIILNSCGESIACIWVKNSIQDVYIYIYSKETLKNYKVTAQH